MTGNPSLFSCIKGDGGGAPEPDNRPPPPPQAPRSPDLTVKITELEASLKKLGQEVSRGAAAEKRLAELERAVPELCAKVEKAAAACDLAAKQNMAGGRGGADMLAKRLDAVEAALAKAGDMRPAASPESLEKKLEGAVKFMSQTLEARASKAEDAVAELAHKAAAAHEAAGAGLRRLEKIDERLARAAYVEMRLASIEKKFEKFCECEAAVEGLKVGLESLEGTVRDAIHRVAVQAGEQKRAVGEFESLSRQVAQLSALFNHFRVELGFLMPKSRETTGG